MEAHKEWPSVDSLNTSRGVGTALTQEDQHNTLARLATVCAKHRHTGTHSLITTGYEAGRMEQYLRASELTLTFSFSFFVPSTNTKLTTLTTQVQRRQRHRYRLTPRYHDNETTSTSTLRTT